jgi:uncharacterized membrane protein YsdA (DUF1294 family)
MSVCVRKALDVLKPGSCEVLKASVHAMALGVIAVMGVYNTAAWLRRREPHLALNAILYGALTAWERQHICHHIAAHREYQVDHLSATTPDNHASEPTKAAA